MEVVRTRAVPLLCSAFVLGACSNDLDVLFEHAPDAAVPSTPVVADDLPRLPVLPDQDREAACEACAAETCAAERAACVDEAACRALLMCHGECRDPECVTRCRSGTGQPATHDSGLPRFDRFLGCVYGSACSADCGAGDNFGCRGAFEWGRVLGGPLEIEVRAETFLPGWPVPFASVDWCNVNERVEACGSSNTMAFGTPEGTTGAWGGVTLSLAVVPGSRGTIGYLLLQDASTLPTLTFPGRPLLRDETLVAPVWAAGNRDIFASRGGVNLVDGTATVQLDAVDCTGRPAPDLVVAIEPSSPDTVFCDAYTTCHAVTTSAAPGFIIHNVAAEEVRISARRDDDVLLQSLPLLLEPDVVARVTLWPPARGEEP